MKPHLVVGALIFGLATLTGCSSSSDEWAEFDARAESVCSEGNDAIGRLGQIRGLATRDASAYWFTLATIQARTAGQLAHLQVPRDDGRVSVQLVARLESLARKSREYAAQIKAGETAIDGAMRQAAVDAQNAALHLGLTECARFGLP